MAPPPLNIQSKLKISLKTAISKLKFIQDKKTALAKQQRRSLADLLNQGKESSATIRVENLIRDDIYVELLEYIELYCELLLARITLVSDPARTTCDESLKEAIQSVIYASPHTELKEIAAIRDILVHKYGPEFGKSAIENEDGHVPSKIVSRCEFTPPSEMLVRLYLSEIAKTYNAPYSHLEKSEPKDEEKDNSDDSDDPTGGESLKNLEQPIAVGDSSTVSAPKSAAAAQRDDFDALKARFAALKGSS
ncbi:vacuolar protein sorting-associated protein Ist1p [[Candida] anglica]|uniref:Vacuolar protein sorting-associated protein Ist1p n=1 Tax=[Candida] anglica TaxID=148631 RepID=A0ABP0ENI7_9ASCO